MGLHGVCTRPDHKFDMDSVEMIYDPETNTEYLWGKCLVCGAPRIEKRHPGCSEKQQVSAREIYNTLLALKEHEKYPTIIPVTTYTSH